MEYTEKAEAAENVENQRHDDTEKLLRECNAGIKMGISSIDEVLPSVHDGRLKGILENSRREHADLGDETHELLLPFRGSTHSCVTFSGSASLHRLPVILLPLGDYAVVNGLSGIIQQ